MSELLNCPFCGSEAYIREHGAFIIKKYSVQCSGEVDCPIYQCETYQTKNRDNAIKEWNKRA